MLSFVLPCFAAGFVPPLCSATLFRQPSPDCWPRGCPLPSQVINLRTLRPLDRPAVIESVKKTSRLVTVEEGWSQCGIGAELIATIIESPFLSCCVCVLWRGRASAIVVL